MADRASAPRRPSRARPRCAAHRSPASWRPSAAWPSARPRERAERAARSQRLERRARARSRVLPAAWRSPTALAGALEAVARARRGPRGRAGRRPRRRARASPPSCARAPPRRPSIQQRLRERGEAVTVAEVRAQQARDRRTTPAPSSRSSPRGWGSSPSRREEPLDRRGGATALRARIERLARRREQLGPVNPLAKAGVRGGARARRGARGASAPTSRRRCASCASLIRDTDRQIRETFEETFTAAAEQLRGARGAAVPRRPRPPAAGARGQPGRGRCSAAPRPGRRRRSRTRPPRPRPRPRPRRGRRARRRPRRRDRDHARRARR